MPRPKKYEKGAQKAKSIRIRIQEAERDYKNKLRELARKRSVSVSEYAWEALKEHVNLQMKEITTQEFIELLEKVKAELNESLRKLLTPSDQIPLKKLMMDVITTYINSFLIDLLQLRINSEANIIIRCDLGSKEDVYRKWANELLKNHIISTYNDINIERLVNFFENEQLLSENSIKSLKLSRVTESIFVEKNLQFYENKEFLKIVREEFADFKLMIQINNLRILSEYFYPLGFNMEQGLAESLEIYLEVHNNAQLDEYQIENLNFVVNALTKIQALTKELNQKRQEFSTVDIFEEFGKFIADKLDIELKGGENAMLEDKITGGEYKEEHEYYITKARDKYVKTIVENMKERERDKKTRITALKTLFYLMQNFDEFIQRGEIVRAARANGFSGDDAGIGWGLDAFYAAGIVEWRQIEGKHRYRIHRSFYLTLQRIKDQLF